MVQLETNHAAGAARRWFQTPNRIPAEEMAARIETMVSPILFGASESQSGEQPVSGGIIV
jgi:hypothetical protein